MTNKVKDILEPNPVVKLQQGVLNKFPKAPWWLRLLVKIPFNGIHTYETVYAVDPHGAVFNLTSFHNSLYAAMQYITIAQYGTEEYILYFGRFDRRN